MLASGALAQLGEHQLCKLGVAGSSPARSTFGAPANAGVSSQTETLVDPCPQNVRDGRSGGRQRSRPRAASGLEAVGGVAPSGCWWCGASVLPVGCRAIASVE